MTSSSEPHFSSYRILLNVWRTEDLCCNSVVWWVFDRSEMSQAVSEYVNYIKESGERIERAAELQEGTAAVRRHNPKSGPKDANVKARHTGTHFLFNWILIIFAKPFLKPCILPQAEMMTGNKYNIMSCKVMWWQKINKL